VNTLTAFVPVSKFWPSTILALAITTVGCARHRDFAVVEPGLSRQYQANAMLAAAPPTPTVVGVQQVAGQRNTAVPVYQTQPPAAVPANATVAPPPSSTATTGGQPYYMAGPAGPVPVPATAPPTPAMQFAPVSGAVQMQPSAAGVYPAAPTGMWNPTRGNQAIALHQFTTPTTGSSFVPSVPMDGSTASSIQPSDGILPAGATVPFTSAIPNGPPPQTERRVFLSDSGEARQPSRIPPSAIPPTAVPPPSAIERPDNTIGATPLPVPPNAGTAVRPSQSQPQRMPAQDPLDDPAPPPSQRKSPAPPVGSQDDDLTAPKTTTPKFGETRDAPSSSPPRTGSSKSPPSNDAPKTIEMPGADAKKDANKKPTDRSDSAPKKIEPLPPTKKSDGKSKAPDNLLPPDEDADLPTAPPPARGSGS